MDSLVIAITVGAVILFWLLPVLVAIKKQQANSRQRESRDDADSYASNNVKEFAWESPAEEGRSVISDLHGKSKARKQKTRPEPMKEEPIMVEQETSDVAQHLQDLMENDISSVVVASEIISRKY